jgi:cytoskeleton protein RodZ
MSEDPQALGQRLKAERERRGLSTQKIANGMHLDEWVIDALETGDYRRIGPEVYAKGHLRKYASLLGVSAAPPPVDAVPPSVPSTATGYPPPIVRLDPPQDDHAVWPRVGAVVAVVILVGGVFWWRESHRGLSAPSPALQPAPPVAASTEASPEDAAAPVDRADLADEAAPAATSAAAPMNEAAAAPPRQAPATPAMSANKPLPSPNAEAPLALSAPTASPAAAGPAAAGLTPGVGKARLRLSFSADSWVEIRDYSGKRIFSGNGRANSVKTVAGAAPFRVFLRSASGVQLQLNERAVAIGRQFISGDEARFEAGADGVLRRDPPPAPGNDPQTAAVSPHG